ncbi:MAG: type VI secretion system tip protein TssI/VgrG [Solidesulfovibrio sp. DCME]|uniref:type VI secretion system Vgr family protein n=1 Tax=Solidesulfovibrio sp. DCME TaxID=3447380 RepID=UPI003D144B2D
MDDGFAELRLRFTSGGAPGDTFEVVAFEGHEGLSELYAFTVDLVSDVKDCDVDALLASAASLTVSRPQGDVPWHGILESFTEDREVNGRYFYQAVLRPRAWRLTLERRNQVFVDKAIPEVLEQVLRDGALPANAWAMRLKESYPQREFVCQYGETLYDFLVRWLARYGMYFFFEQGEAGETMVITDTKLAHVEAPGASQLTYWRTSGLETAHLQQTVHDFGARRVLTPSKVTLKDYNYRKPDLDLTVTEEARLKGAGETYVYGDHYPTPEAGRKLAKLRVEGLAAAATTFAGQSFVPGLRPGFTFGLTRHFQEALNRSYLAVTVAHQGRSALAGTSGLREPQGAGEPGRPHYQNAFTAIAADVQYRPPLRPRAVLPGIMNAHIDAAGSGTYPELDDAGRYKVKFPFDQSGLAAGKASSAVRLTQPYGGAGFGLHYPLHKGAEAAVAYVDGNPDRPVLVGAAPNPQDKSPVTNDTQTQCRLTTASGHALHIEDREGSQRILLKSSTGEYLRIGAHNDPGPTDSGSYFSPQGISIYTPPSNWMKVTCQNQFLTVLGETLYLYLGVYNENAVVDLELNETFQLNFLIGKSYTLESIYEAVKNRKLNVAQTTVQYAGSNNSVITGQEIQVAQEKTDTALSNRNVDEKRLRVVDSHVDTAEDHVTTAEESFQTVRSQSVLAGQAMETTQNAVRSLERLMETASQRTTLAQEDVVTVTRLTQTVANRTEMAESRIVTVSNVVEMVADEQAMALIVYKQN